MKKIYLLLLTAFVATISMAQVVPPTNTRPVSQNGFLPVDNILLQQGQSMANIFKAPSDNPITQQPEGTNYTNVNRSGRGYYNSVLGVDFGEYTCTLGEYVVGNDNNVYIKNPFSQQRTNSYLKLERLSGDTLIARLPQAIDTKNGEKTFAMRMVMKMLDDEHFTYSPDTLSDKTIASDMKFIMRNDSIIQLSDGKEEQYGRPKTILGEMSEDGYWTGFGDDEEIWSLIKETATTLPEGLTIEDYQLRYAPTDSTLSSQMVKVAFDDKNIYISNLSQGNEW
ncbi:hypothetical protein [Prevotella dentasini]|uniref:hypothetical protein n=1 Tax=Prevotella dentasini TaxID=589537 RepID=UPI0011DC8DCF|nr:hypothetical protein [Prevotella dentasini]